MRKTTIPNIPRHHIHYVVGRNLFIYREVRRKVAYSGLAVFVHLPGSQLTRDHLFSY